MFGESDLLHVDLMQAAPRATAAAAIRHTAASAGPMLHLLVHNVGHHDVYLIEEVDGAPQLRRPRGGGLRAQRIGART